MAISITDFTLLRRRLINSTVYTDTTVDAFLTELVTEASTLYPSSDPLATAYVNQAAYEDVLSSLANSTSDEEEVVIGPYEHRTKQSDSNEKLKLWYGYLKTAENELKALLNTSGGIILQAWDIG